ncbi:exonuclease domain-containing protein [Candidatus Vidania fulgoroideae]|uniref:DNA polymerase III subunit epsilon n=1 Tax=Candidatus Vidania fulgoroideorum TaxID=881286 RepID=A0AAX3N8K0_9PROT|nr:exonuclease domain-containing protein [Candidatus Vidania fulgoroideae]WDR79369.1 exonuclease domain-containing protein [Candidatus Vidania fulgoroideae]
MKRFISLDTETTGLDIKNDRIIEISCNEIINFRITGKKFHSYIKTDREINKEAYKIHKINKKILINKPIFKKISKKIIKIIKKSKVIIHNVNFDYKILKEEFKRIGKKIKFKTIDTLKIARKKFPGKKNSLTYLCKRFKIKKKKKHSALQDSINLAKVFILMSSKQRKINIKKKKIKKKNISNKKKKNIILFK